MQQKAVIRPLVDERSGCDRRARSQQHATVRSDAGASFAKRYSSTCGIRESGISISGEMRIDRGNRGGRESYFRRRAAKPTSTIVPSIASAIDEGSGTMLVATICPWK